MNVPTQVVRRSARLAASSKVVSTVRAPKRRKLSVSATTPVDSATSTRSHIVEEREEVKVQVANEASIKRKDRKKKVIEEPDPADYPRVSNDWKFGAHVSAAGGVENTIVNAAATGANAFALFLKSQRKWSSSVISEDSVSLFKSRLQSFGYSPYHVLPHGNYLINLGNPDAEKRRKSYDCFLDDLQRCELLGLKLYNFHPGSTVGLVSKEECISLIAECLNKAHKETKSVITVIENMAGAGNVVGSKFTELASIIDQVEDKERVGVCLDTCHAYAADYDLTTRIGYEATLAEFDSVIGLRYLRAMHLNDSKTPLGSNRDRHENIGLGHLTLSAFAFVARDPRLKDIPLILETSCSSSSDPTGESPDVWQAEIDLLNRLSRTEETKECQLPSVDGYAGTNAFMVEWRDMTMTMEQIIGRLAVINGGGGKEAAKKKSTKGKGRGKRKKCEDGDENGIDASDC